MPNLNNGEASPEDRSSDSASFGPDGGSLAPADIAAPEGNPLEWRGDTTVDGRFAIESEHVKGEGRLYRLNEWVGDRWEPTGIGSDDKRHIKRMARKLRPPS
jgi:hypothetical protein